MARVRQRNTAPELQLRRALWKKGLRYRLHRKDLPGTPDLVFSPERVAVFVHGCFWHSHGCPRSRKLPIRNAEFWANKLALNISRDAKAQSDLAGLGWMPVIVWECEELEQASSRVLAALARPAKGV